MTPKEAHKYVEDLQRMLTQYRFHFSEKFIEANGVAVEALEKQIPQPTTVDGAWNYCPACGTTIPNSFFNKPKYCHRCGQRIELPKGD